MNKWHPRRARLSVVTRAVRQPPGTPGGHSDLVLRGSAHVKPRRRATRRARERNLLARSARPPARAATAASRGIGTLSLTERIGAYAELSKFGIVLLVPRVTSLAVPFDTRGDDRAVIVDEYRAMAASVGAHVTVLFCIARRLADVVHSMVGPASLVIVGGRRRAWWPSREQRLVERLTAEGYAVVFADVGADHARMEVHAVAS